MTCAFVGDSIAVGLAEHSTHQCISFARVGASSAEVLSWFVMDADTVVISVGSNDPDNPNLEDNVRGLRAKFHHRVIWILPMNANAARTVQAVAYEHKDTLVWFEPAPDGVHPKNYDELESRLGAAQ